MRHAQTALVLAAIGLSACGTDPRPYSTFLFDERPAQVAALSERCTIYFDVDSAEVRDDQKPAVDGCARALAASLVPITLVGHADERGASGYNQSLGEQRAHAVAAELARRGIEQDRLSVASLGEQSPIKQGAGEETWSANRRVDVAPRR